MKNASVENITVRLAQRRSILLLAPIKCTYERGTLIRTLIRLDWQMRNWFSMGQNNFHRKKTHYHDKREAFRRGKVTENILCLCGRRLWKCNLMGVFLRILFWSRFTLWLAKELYVWRGREKPMSQSLRLELWNCSWLLFGRRWWRHAWWSINKQKSRHVYSYINFCLAVKRSDTSFFGWQHQFREGTSTYFVN